jgi:anthranilate synthase component 1
MLVDLGRNDVGRVCRPSSVRVSDVLSIERYSHVMHLSSTVTGELSDGLTAFDALRAALPVGTVSGAPKLRAMQIIDEFEPTRRGPYAGAVGYIDFAGNMDTCIGLRTMVIRGAGEGAGGRARGAEPEAQGAGRGGEGPAPFLVDIQVGAGIVADSVPALEYEETLNKARGQLAAIALAEQAFA